MCNIENSSLQGYFPISESRSPNKGDDSRKGGLNCNALGFYSRRGKNVGMFGIGIVATNQLDDTVTRYGQDKSCARARMVYHLSIRRASRR
jgi:hypothetical protein